MDTTQVTPTTVERTRRKFQFRLRTLLFFVALLAVTLCALGIHLRQQRARHTAFIEISKMGFRHTISGSGSPGQSVGDFRYTKSYISDRDIDRFASYLEVLARRFMLGFSRGLEIRRIDLSNSGVTETAISELQRRFPSAEVRY